MLVSTLVALSVEKSGMALTEIQNMSVSRLT